MRSRLSPRLEEIRLQIAGTHNAIAVMVGFPLVILFFVYVFMTGHNILGHDSDLPTVVVWMLPISAVEFGGLGLLVWLVGVNDDRLCRESGFVCRNCGKPLYASGSWRLLAGLCPHCGQKIVDEPVTLSA